ncbi:MAG TPA: FecR domain-containing protein [Steroidobacteraceae bacterium]|nr:FecR domain-containing protein [Steroidobacteraceae bacterium]
MTSLGDWVAQEIPQPITDDAAGWMALLDSERCNEADRLAFARWLDEDPRHRWAFQELSEVWAQLRTLGDVRPMMDWAQVRRLPSARPAAPAVAPTLWAPRREWSTLLASVFAIVGLLIHLGFNAQAQRFSTGTAEVRNVLLPDGSTVELNARTTMTVEMDKALRQVRLDAGDAVFHVARDGRPFVVATARGEVAALGTSFAVQQDDAGMEVSVLEGRVAVTLASAELPLTVYDGKVDFTPRAERAVLDPGERVGISTWLHDRESVTEDQLRRDLAWRHGWVEYQDEPLQSVIGDMRRYSPVSIHLADRRLRDIRVTGRFQIGDVSGLLDHLGTENDVRVDHGGPRWVVLRSTKTTRVN